VKPFLIAFVLLLTGFAGMALGRLWGREPLRSCGRCELPCGACPSRGPRERMHEPGR
jgi:hypothetical protein